MKLTPQHAPLYGECVLTVQLDDRDAGEEEEKELEFYLSFSGSTQRHVSSTLRVSHSTLQAVCPGHDVCEQVVVTLCVACPGKPVATLSEEAFSFDQDLALDMARFLLDTTAPEEALLLDDEQIPLKECERLDQNLALALKHLSLCHPRTAPQTSALTCAQTITAPDTHTQKEARPCVSVLSDSNTAVSQSQQLSSLLHLAASHGLWTVASFLLQQPGAREALRTANAHGQTPVCVAQGKGHEQLVELFTQYETSPDVKVEPKDQLLWHQEGRLLQHHAKHSTYTITFCCRQQMEAGAKTDGGERCSVQEEVEELRRLIQLHRKTKLESCAATTTEKYACFDCDLQPCSSRQHNIRHDASRLVVNTENSNTTAEKQGSPQWQQEPCPSAAHKVVGGQRHTTATKSPTGRKKKNKKRTTKTTRHATAGNNSSSLKASRLNAQGLSEITSRDCVPEAGASVSLKGLALRCEISEGGVTSSSRTDKTQPVSVLADDEKCTGRKATTAITEKQESEKWEVDALMCEQATEKETEAAVNQSPSTRQDQCVESTERRADTMGQEQSQDPQESQSESEELRQPDSTNQAQSDSRTSPRSPGVEGKPLTGLWRDGGWIGSRTESDTVANTIWYQGEHMDHVGIEASNRQEVNSQTVWYDYDEQTQEQLKETKRDLIFPQKYDKSPSQLLEQGFSSHQLCSALSQPHAAGAQPAPSHGLATQRQEVQGSRQEEEVGPDWQEGGEEEVWNRETTHSRKNSETADLEEWGEGKPEEREAKGRKKRRRKKWKRRSSEAKLSSSSSVESHNQNETHTEQGTSPNCQSEAKDQTGRTHVCSPTFSEPTWVGEEADKDAMHLPSQTRGSHQPDCAVITSESSCTRPTNHAGPDQAEPVLSQTLEIKELLMDESMSIHGSDHFNLDSTVAVSELCDMSIKKADGEEMNPGQPKGKDVFGPTELDLKGHTSPTVDDMESNALSPHQCRTVAVAPGEPTVLVEFNFPKELPIKTTVPTGLTEDLLLVVFPEENKVDAQSEDKPVQPVNLMEKPLGLMESVHPSIAQCLPCEGTTDVRPLEIQEGSPETTHCLSSNMLRDLQLKEENRHEPLAGNEEGKETSWRRDNRECRVMDSEVLSSVEQGQNLEFPPSKTEHLSNDDLVITAAAVVTVAIASAMARIELSQQLSSATGSSISTLVQDTNEPTDKHSHAKLSNDLDSDSHGFVSETLESQPKTETLCSPLVPKETIRSETILSDVFPCRLSDHHKLLQVNMSPLPETHERITAEVDSQGHIQPQVQPPCPPLDTGQESELDTAPADTASKANNSPQDQSAGQTHRDGLSSALHETHPAATDGSDPAPSLTGEAVGQGHEHEKARPERPVSKTDGFHVEEHESDPQLVEHLHDGEILTLPLLPSPALPAVLCLSPPVTDPRPEELEALACTESVELQLCEWPEDSKPVTGTFQSEGNEPVAVDDVCDEDCASLELVDEWNRSEGEKLELVEEARKDMLTVQDTPQKGAEICPTSEGEYEQTKRHSDNPHNVQIQREKDFCCPVQPCPQPSTDASCIDARPGRDDAVSVCVLQKGCERLQGTSDRDDGVFKKPFPPSCAGHGDKGVRVPADVPVLADITPSQCTANTVDSESESLCLKPEIQTAAEGFSGGVTEGRGRAEKEEKKAHLSESPLSSAILRASLRSLSPLRRHSWEPGQSSSCKDTGITQRSSLKSLSGEARRAKPPLHRRSMSWCPSNLCRPDQEQIENRSYSLERLEVQRASLQSQSDQEERTAGQSSHLDSQERGSLISLTEEEQEGDGISIDSQASSEGQPVANICPAMFHHQPLSKSVSMDTISHRNIDVRGFSASKRRITFSLSISPLLTKNRRFFSIASSSSDDEEEEVGRLSSFSSNASTLEYSISEEEPGPLRSETEGKVQGPKISRTFSYLRSKMSKKVKEKEKRGDRERDREKKSNGHVFIQLSPSPSSACQHCTKLLHKEAFLCSGCGVQVHKSCRDNLPVCIKSKAKQQLMVPDAGLGTTVNMRSKAALSASPVSSTSSSSLGERWSTLTSPDEQFSAFPWRPSNNLHSNLSKSVSISNIAGLEDAPLKGLKFLSQSTDNLHQGSKVNASTESLTDEGTEMIDSQLMGEFECDVKDLEADSWSSTVDKKFLKTLKKDEIKRQDVIYELFQTEFHHVRTLKIMFEVYYKGLQKEIQLDTQTQDKIFPVLDKLLDIHTQFLSRLLEMKRTSSAEGRNSSLLICRIGNLLVTQFSDTNADHMKKAYGKFCSRHNEAVNLYKDLHAKDKRFQAFIKKTMSSSIVRRLSIPECILLVTQRITKYPVLIQRILQHTKDSDEDHGLVSEALRCVKEVITAVDSKVNEHEKKCRLREVYSRTDSKSIMRMKSGQMFAKEDLIRRGKLLHDGALQLKNSAGRLKDVHALLLSDVLVFLQEKDQKYVFASLDQRSTVMSMQNLIVREVANEERGLFLITAGTDRPEMVEVLASSKEERNSWRAVIQDAMHCMEKDEDEGVPSETEEDRKQQENRAKEIRELLRSKDKQIVSLLEEKVHIFRELSDCPSTPEDVSPQIREGMLFRATPDDVTRGEPIITNAIREVESLHTLVHRGVGGAGCSAPVGLAGGGVGPVCLPRRAETFGGFDSHQMNSSKNGEKEEGDESLDLRRTESDSLLKKGAAASLQMLLKKNNEVQQSVSHLHHLLISLQAVVVQQDSFIEDQRQALNDRLTGNCSRHSSSSSLSSSSSSRPSSLIEQEKHRSLERQRQEAASLQKQQAAYQEERRRREREWELKERGLGEWEERLREEEEETRKRHQELVEERESLQRKKEEFQREVERLREAQKKLERDKETLRRETEQLEAMRKDESEQLHRYQRTPSSTSEESLRFHSSGSLDVDSKEAAEPPKEVELSSSAPTKEPFLRIGSKRMSKSFNPFSSSSSSKHQGAEKESQLPTRLLQLTKPKEKKDKKKKKGKGGEQAQTEATVMLDTQHDGDIFFC